MFLRFLQFISSKSLRIFFISSLFHLSLYFSPNNKVTFILTILLTTALYHSLKKIPLTLFYVFFLTLPFAKGKGIDILLLDKKFILKNAIFNVDYVFPIYFSTIYFCLFYLYQLREKLFFKSKVAKIAPTTIIASIFFCAFIAIGALGSILGNFFLPVFLSSAQLILLMLVFFMPYFMNTGLVQLKKFYQIIASSIAFQSIWLILQTLNKGHLGKDIEVLLPGFEFSVRSTENFDLMRLPGTFFESSILGTFLVTNLAVLLFVLTKHKTIDQKEKILFSGVSILGYLALLLTGSRAIYIVAAILLIIFAKIKGWLTLKGYQKMVKTIKSNYLVLPLIFGALLLMSPYLISRLGSSNKLFTKEGSATYRLELNKFAFRLTEKSPLFGVGLNLSPYYFATAFPQEDYFVDPAHPHNIFIQILAETGTLGLSAFTLFLYFIFRPLFKKAGSLNAFTLAALIFLLCAQIYPIFINHMEIISYLFLYLGLSSAIMTSNSNEK